MKVSHIIEARYAGRYKTDDVFDQYNKTINSDAERPVEMVDVSKGTDNIVKGALYVYADTEFELRNVVDYFMRKYNAPYDEIIEIERYYENEWYASVSYKGES